MRSRLLPVAAALVAFLLPTADSIGERGGRFRESFLPPQAPVHGDLVDLQELPGLGAGGVADEARNGSGSAWSDAFDALDWNGDGSIDREEALESWALWPIFDDFDVDTDGRITSYEWHKINTSR